MKQTHEEILKKEVFEALGKTTALFMTQECRGVDIVMPTGELERIGNALLQKLTQIRNEVLEEVGKEIDLQKTDERKVANFGEWHAETYNEKMLVNAVLHDSKERILKLKTKI